MPPKTYKPRANTLSRADLANPSNGDSEDDEDVSGSSSDEDSPFSDDEDEDYYPDCSVDRDSQRELSRSTSIRSAQTGRNAPAQVHGTRSSARLAGELLPTLHSIGLYNNQAKVSRSRFERKRFLGPNIVLVLQAPKNKGKNLEGEAAVVC